MENLVYFFSFVQKNVNDLYVLLDHFGKSRIVLFENFDKKAYQVVNGLLFVLINQDVENASDDLFY